MCIFARFPQVVIWQYENFCFREEIILDLLEQSVRFTRDDLHLDEIKHATTRDPADLNIGQPDLAFSPTDWSNV